MQVIYKKCSILIIIVVSILLSGCYPIPLNSQHTPEVIKGELYLDNWDFANDGTISLNGQWDFYWKQLLTPDDFKHSNLSITHPDAAEWIDVPSSWNGYNVNGDIVNGNGYATYHLTIYSQKTHRQLGLYVSPMSSAYKLWVNGELLAANGIVGKNLESMVPQHLTRSAFFSQNEEKMDIVVQVSNFHHRRGGMWDYIELGLAKQIADKRDRYLAFEMFIVGSLMIMGIYHIGLFALRRHDRSPLYFGIFCLIIGFRSLLVGEAYWYMLFSSFRWELGLKIEYILTFICVPIALKYISELYPRFSSKKIILLSYTLGITYCSIVLVTPAQIFTKTLFSYQMIILMTIIYILYILALAIIQRERGSILISVGVLFYAVTVMNDILYYNEILMIGDYTSVGLFIFIFAHSFVLSMKFSKAFSDINLMSEQLKQLNIGLEEKVKERTYDLVEFNEHLTLANKELYRMETSRRHLLSNISHDLRTPMTSIQGYVEAFLDGVVVDPKQQKEYLKLIHSKAVGINRLIKDLFELSQLESGQISFSLLSIEVHQLMSDVAQKYETDINRAGLKFYLSSSIPNSSSNTYVWVDTDRLDRVFSNLIFNAIRHTREGMITISYEIISSPETLAELSNNQFILIKIEDTGSGIDEEKLPYIFDRFYKESDARNTSIGGSGLGLAISKEIVLSHGGRIWAESIAGKGSTFCFTLPVADKHQD